MKLKNNIEELQILLNITELPEVVEKYIIDSKIYNKSSSGKSNVIFLSDKSMYLKIAELNSLENEYKNTVFLNKLGVAGEVIDYIKDDYRDYLLVKEIKGENGISDSHIKDPKKLASSFGKHLRMIHELQFSQCPMTNRIEEIINLCNKNVKEGKINMNNFFNKYGFTPNQGLLMLDSLKDNCINDVIIHGDYYLPNIIMNNYNFSGIVDVGWSGIGDRHYDIISGLHSLSKNFNTRQYDDLFLDAYGRELIDKDRLAFAKLLLILN